MTGIMVNDPTQAEVEETAYLAMAKFVCRADDVEDVIELRLIDLSGECGLYKDIDEKLSRGEPVVWVRASKIRLSNPDGRLTHPDIMRILGMLRLNNTTIQDPNFSLYLTELIHASEDETCLNHPPPNSALRAGEVSNAIGTEEDGDMMKVRGQVEGALLPWVAKWVAPGMNWTDVEALPSYINKKLVATLRQIVPETVSFEVFSAGVHHHTTEYVENKENLCKRSSFRARKIENQDFKLVIKWERTLETFFEWVGFGKDEMAKQIGKKEEDELIKLWRLSDYLEDRALQTLIMEALVSRQPLVTIKMVKQVYEADVSDHGLKSWVAIAIAWSPACLSPELEGIVGFQHSNMMLRIRDSKRDGNLSLPTVSDMPMPFTNYTKSG